MLSQRASAETMVKVSTPAQGVALSSPAAGSEVPVRVHLGFGPAALWRFGSAVLG